jgi:hypothetical protein
MNLAQARIYLLFFNCKMFKFIAISLLCRKSFVLKYMSSLTSYLGHYSVDVK